MSKKVTTELWTEKMQKASVNITKELKQVTNFSKKEQADMCFIMAIELFKDGQEDLSAKFMERALSTDSDFVSYGMPMKRNGA